MKLRQARTDKRYNGKREAKAKNVDNSVKLPKGDEKADEWAIWEISSFLFPLLPIKISWLYTCHFITALVWVYAPLKQELLWNNTIALNSNGF